VATRNDIIAAIQATDRRLSALAPAILADPERLLRNGNWTVRDALCHVAARANGIALSLSYADANPAAAGAPPPLEIDEVNRRQIAERQGRAVPALLAEIAEGHRAAIGRLAELDDALLARPLDLPFLEPGSTVSDLILLAVPRHEQAHLDLIAETLDASARS
jgi:hypothetical protein